MYLYERAFIFIHIHYFERPQYNTRVLELSIKYISRLLTKYSTIRILETYERVLLQTLKYQDEKP